MHVLGDYNSPVIPALIYVPAKMSAFSMECYDRGLAVRPSPLLCLFRFLFAFFRLNSSRVGVVFLFLSSSTKA